MAGNRNLKYGMENVNKEWLFLPQLPLFLEEGAQCSSQVPGFKTSQRRYIFNTAQN